MTSLFLIRPATTLWMPRLVVTGNPRQAALLAGTTVWGAGVLLTNSFSTTTKCCGIAGVVGHHKYDAR